MISGVHVIIESQDPDADRAFFRDVLGLESVDAGSGWLIFALPPAEVAFHPGESGRHQLYLMCPDLDETMRQLDSNGVRITGEITEQRWGRIVSIALPG